MIQDVKFHPIYVIILACLLGMAVFSGLQAPAFAEDSRELTWQEDGVTLTARTDGETAVITGCESQEKYYEVDIPEAIEGIPVSAIEADAFQENCSITKVSLPDGVKSLPDSAFYKCSALQSIDLNQVEDMGETYGGWTRLGETLSLETIEVAEDNPAFTVSDGILFSRDMTALILYPPLRPGRSYVIPETVTTLWSRAFSRTQELEEVTLSSGISSYWDSFWACPRLRSMDLNMLSYIGGSNFSRCSALESVTVAEDNPNLESADGALFSEDGSVLLFCPPVRPGDAYRVPEGVTAIGDSAFMISKLKEIELPGTLREIRGWGFAYAQSLEYLVFPEGLEKIGTNVCTGCESLKAVYVPDSVKEIVYGSLDGPMMGPYAVIYGHTRGEDGEFTYAYQYVSDHADEYVFKDIDEEPMFQPQTITGPAGFEKNLGCAGFSLAQKAKTDLSYESGNEDIATVSTKGVVRILRPGTVRITVTARASGGFAKAVRTVTVKARLKAPALKAKKGSRKVKLSWNRIPGARGYQLYVKFPGSKKFTRVLTESSKVKSVTHRGLTKGKTYKYKLRAYTRVGSRTYYSDFSKVRKVKIR